MIEAMAQWAWLYDEVRRWLDDVRAEQAATADAEQEAIDPQRVALGLFGAGQ